MRISNCLLLMLLVSLFCGNACIAGGTAGSENKAKAVDYSGPWVVHPEFVLSPGPAGSWDGNQLQSPCVIKVGDEYYMYYLGQDKAKNGTYRTGLATSKDLLHWKKHPANPIVSPEPGKGDEGKYTADAEVLVDGDLYRMYYVRDRIYYAESRDGVRWDKVNVNRYDWKGSKANNICLDRGEAGSWEALTLADPQVLKVGDVYHMYYCAVDRPYNKGGQVKIGHATSDDGVNWKKNPQNPLLSPDENEGGFLAGNHVVHRNGKFYMFYNYRNKKGKFQIALATSDDGTKWVKHPKNPIISTGPKGLDAVAQPCFYEDERGTFLFFMVEKDGKDYIAAARLATPPAATKTQSDDVSKASDKKPEKSND